VSSKFTPSTLLLLIVASLLWGGAAIYFNLATNPFYPFALDGATWEKARGGLVATEIVPAGPADQAGLFSSDTLLLVNGVSVTSEPALQEIIDQIPADQLVIYTVRRGDALTKLEVSIKQFRTLRGYFNSEWLKKYDMQTIERQMESLKFQQRIILSWLFKPAGILLILLAIWVYVKKPELTAARLFFLTGLITGFGLATGNVDAFDLPDRLRFLYFLLVLGYIFFIPPLTLDFFRRLLFFSTFSPPQRVTILTYIPAFLGYTLSVGLLIFALAEGRAPVVEPPKGALGIVQNLLMPASWLAYLLWGAIELITRLKRKQAAINPRLGKWLLWGVIIPTAIYTAALILSTLASQDYLEWSKTFLVPLPLVLAYLILKERLLDIRVVIKRSAIYAILSTLLIGTFVILVLGISQLAVFLTGQESKLAIFAAALITAVAFNFYRLKVQSYLDRKFFKERHNYQKALLEFSKDLSRLEAVEPLLAKVACEFAGALHLSNCLPFVYDQKADVYVMVAPYCLPDPALLNIRYSASEFGLTTLLVQEKRPLEFYDLESNPLYANLPVAEKVALKKTDTAVAVPLLVKEKLVGMLHLGNKKSGDYFNPEDIDFFATLSSSLSVAVENARLHREEMEKCKMEQELGVARRIQEKLLGRELPKLPGIDLYAAYLPSRQVSGDMYSVIPVKNNQLALAIGDVSGKGIPASLLMASLHASLKMLCLECFPPADIISRLNRLVCENTDPEDFVTFFYAVYDRDTRKLSYVNAGHNPPLYFQANGRPKELSEGGIPLGIFSDRPYQAVELSVQPGSPIVLYTDGVTEADNEFEEQFGCRRLAEIVAQNRHLSAQEVGERILSGLQGFCGGKELEDDVSLVILKTV